MKIAILLAGPYRGNPTNIANHIKIIGNYDTYVSCFEHYKEDWINSGWPIKKIFTTPNIDFKETNWSKYRDDAPGQSGFWQFWNLKNVINNVEEDYDWYIKSRCDLDFQYGELSEYFFSTLEPNTLYTSIHRFVVGAPDLSIVNDQFYIADSKVMDIISKFPTKYYNQKRHRLNEANHLVGSNEKNLTIWLAENGVNIKKIQDILYNKNHNGINTASGESGFQLEKI
jgi:hypothetical protein